MVIFSKLTNSSHDLRLQERYLHMQIRKRFEENRNIKDYRLAKKLLEEGKQELHDNRAPPINCKLIICSELDTYAVLLPS